MHGPSSDRVQWLTGVNKKLSISIELTSKKGRQNVRGNSSVYQRTKTNKELEWCRPAKKIEARVAELIAEKMSLDELRRALTLTQVHIAETLGIRQDSV